MITREIQNRINKAVNDQLVSVLFDPLIAQHKRKGVRIDCECDFCRLSRSIGNVWRTRRMAEKRYMLGPPYCNLVERYT